MLAGIRARRSAALAHGGPEAVDKVHARGKLTARERIDRLVDAGSFREVGSLVEGTIHVSGRAPRVAPCDAVVCGWASVHGRRVLVVADDGSITAGARGPAGMRKATSIALMARSAGRPSIFLLESSALRMQEQMGAQFTRQQPNPMMWHGPGWAPNLCGIMGTALGAASFRVLDADFSVLTAGTGAMALAGPPMVLGGVSQEVTTEELGGARLHARVTGFIDYIAGSEDETLATLRSALEFFPDNRFRLAPRGPRTDPADRRLTGIETTVPLDHRKPYDMRKIITALVDHGQILEVKQDFAKNIITAFAHLDGHSVGVIANQPLHLGGVVDVRSAQKAIRFVQVCNAYRIPLIFLQDQPGFFIGPQSEADGALRQVVRLMKTVSALDSPVLTVVVRKAYGFSMQLLGAKFVGADLVVAWPSASISLAGPELAVFTLLAREHSAGELTEAKRQELYAHYRRMSKGRLAAYDFGVDELIEPDRTRQVLTGALAMVGSRTPARPGPYRKIDPP